MHPVPNQLRPDGVQHALGDTPETAVNDKGRGAGPVQGQGLGVNQLPQRHRQTGRQCECPAARHGQIGGRLFVQVAGHGGLIGLAENRPDGARVLFVSSKGMRPFIIRM